MKLIINNKEYSYTCRPSQGKEYELIVHNLLWHKVYGHTVEHCLQNFKLQYESQSINNRVEWQVVVFRKELLLV